MKFIKSKFLRKTNLDLDNKIVLINKPKGYTSNKVIQIIKKAYGLKKVGHSGTLDPLATGLLIIGTGNQTKKLNEIIQKDKEYIATIKFNFKTSTYDSEGEIVKQINWKVNLFNIQFKLTKLNNVFLYQEPPIFSAIKIKGKKLYEYARKNEEVKLPSRKVFINKIDLIDFDYDKQLLKLRMDVSKGFYIRSFANDLGDALNNCAYLYDLHRTRIGDSTIENAYDFYDLVELSK